MFPRKIGIELVSRVSVGSTVSGVKPKSTEVIFEPGTITSGTYVADPGTAASITMLLQVSLPCLLFPSGNSLGAPSTSGLTLRGGTNATHAPPIDQVIQVLFPFLIKHFDIRPTLTVHRRGFYPRGQGEVSVSIPATSKPLPAVVLRDRGKVTRISGRAYVAGALPAHLPQAMVTTAQEKLIQAGYDKEIISIDQIHEPFDKAFGNGSGIVLWAETDHGCVLSGGSIGDTGKRADAAGKEAADELVANLAHGGCVDEYLQVSTIRYPLSMVRESNGKVFYFSRIRLSSSWHSHRVSLLSFVARYLGTPGTPLPQLVRQICSESALL